MNEKEKQGAAQAKQIDLNIAKLTDEEIKVLIKALESSDLYKKVAAVEIVLNYLLGTYKAQDARHQEESSVKASGGKFLRKHTF